MIETYDQIRLLNEVEKLIQSSSERLNKEQLKVQKAIENSLTIPYDRDKIKLAILTLDSKQIEVANGRELLYDKLEHLTNLSREELQKVEYGLSPIELNTATYTLQNKKELSALKHSVNAYQFLVDKEKGGALPKVFAFGGVGYTSAYKDKLNVRDLPLLGDLVLKADNLALAPGAIVGLGLTWDIFKGNQHKFKVEQAKIDVLTNQHKLDDAQKKLSLLLKKNKADYETAQKKIDVNEQKIRMAENDLNVASKRFQVGLTDVTERLNAENEYYKANLEYYGQIVQQRQLSLELLQTAGELTNKILN